jgi:two-component system chemotaxis response regulator CheY
MTTKNLLVVDDSATTRMLISLTLKKGDDLRIIEASDGKEALAQLDSQHVDLVLTDINMPNMDGLELITRIRSNRREPKIPIIVITTKGEETSRDEGLALGADAYVLKPISGAKLQSLVKELLV